MVRAITLAEFNQALDSAIAVRVYTVKSVLSFRIVRIALQTRTGVRVFLG